MVQKNDFWISNISNRNVSLSDLNLTIKAFATVNLLDKKHYSYSLEQLKKSSESGSIFRKRNKIIIRKSAPLKTNINMLLDRETFIPTREKSIFSMKEEHYEELEVRDEDFARENADLAEIDSKKQILSKG